MPSTLQTNEPQPDKVEFLPSLVGLIYASFQDPVNHWGRRATCQLSTQTSRQVKEPLCRRPQPPAISRCQVSIAQPPTVCRHWPPYG